MENPTGFSWLGNDQQLIIHVVPVAQVNEKTILGQPDLNVVVLTLGMQEKRIARRNCLPVSDGASEYRRTISTGV